MPPARRLTPGQRIADNPIVSHAATANRLLEMAERYGPTSLGESVPPFLRTHDASNVIQVQNWTGADRELGEVVQVGAYILDGLDNPEIDYLWFKALTPAAPFRKFAILREPMPVKDGEEEEKGIAAAHIAGACVAKVNLTDVDHTHASVRDGYHVLQSSMLGEFELLSTAEETGEQLMGVVFAPFSIVEGRLDGDLEYEEEAAVSVWKDDEDTEETLEGVTCWLLPDGKKLAAGVSVVVVIIGSKKRAIAVNACPVNI